MRTLLLSAVTATLVGCTCGIPPQANLTACTDAMGFACLDGIAASPHFHPKPTASKADPIARPMKASATRTENSPSAQLGNKPDSVTAKTTIAPKMEPPSSTQLGDETGPILEIAKSTIAPKTETATSARPGDVTDSVLKKAKSTIAAKMEDPAAEFGAMKRAVRKNTLGKPIDTICGYLKAKNGSGGSTREMPFLYLVEEDEAYVVDGSRDMIAATAYRNICN